MEEKRGEPRKRNRIYSVYVAILFGLVFFPFELTENWRALDACTAVNLSAEPPPNGNNNKDDDANDRE